MAGQRVLITGGSGRLGTALREVLPCVAPSHASMPIEDPEACKRVIGGCWPTVIVHCAGFVSALNAETDKEACWRVNVDGTRNMVQAAVGIRFVYISTDYVFDGEKGDYREDDVPGPVNFYGLSKLAGELIVREHPNTLILRVPFRAGPPWPYPAAFTDQWTSCRFISEVAPDIARVALMDVTGILHIGGGRKRIYDLAQTASPEIGEMERAYMPVRLPRDVSLNSSKWLSLSAQ